MVDLGGEAEAPVWARSRTSRATRSVPICTSLVLLYRVKHHSSPIAMRPEVNQSRRTREPPSVLGKLTLVIHMRQGYELMSAYWVLDRG